VIWGDGVIWGDLSAQGVIWGDLSAQGVIWGDSSAQGVIWGDSLYGNLSPSVAAGEMHIANWELAQPALRTPPKVGRGRNARNDRR
jgi:hypothetical protein